MTSAANLQPDSNAIRACTISRDVQNFDLLIEDMEIELGESWGDLSFDDAVPFFDQEDAASLEFVVIAVDNDDERNLDHIGGIIRSAKERGIKVMLIAKEVGPVALHQLLRLGADDFVPYPLPENALHDSIERMRNSVPLPVGGFQGDPNRGEGASSVGQSLKSRGGRNGIIIAVQGIAGGVGATTLAVNTAWELATISKVDAPKVCLIDLDFQYGAVSTYLDLPRRETIFEILTDSATADADAFMAATQSFKDTMNVFTAPADMLPLDIVTGEDIGRLLDFATSKFDYVVIDMPSVIVSWTETVMQRAQVYFGLFELDLRSAQNILRLIRALKSDALPHDKLRYILNRAPKFTDLTGKSRIKRMAESLDIDIRIQLPDGAIQVTQSNDHGLPLAEHAGKNPLRKEIQKLAKSIHDTNKAVATGRKG